jgi:SAM-dependent methyltransferase
LIDKLRSDLAYSLAVKDIDPNQYPGEPDSGAFAQFMSRASELSGPRILELGTRRAIADLSTRHDALFPNASEYLGTDIEMGVDVDFVADVHRLTQVTGEEQFDIIFTEAGFEHFKYPQLAAMEMMRALRVGGLVFIQTHQTFPIHAVPYDYFRFSKEALAALFGEGMGFKVHAVGYASPAAIYSRVDPDGRHAPAYLHVNLFGEKLAPTPTELVYEFDCLTDAT